MADGIPNFMWAWQHVHRASLGHLVDDLLNANRMAPAANVFVMGVPDDPKLGKIFTDPIESGFSAGDFGELDTLARRYHEDDPGHGVIMGAPHLQKRFQESLWPKAIHTATLEILRSHDEPRGTVTFSGMPVLVNDHWVFGVIQLHREEHDKVYRLASSEYRYNPIRNVELPRSFLEAIVWRALEASRQEIAGPSNGEGIRFADPNRVHEDAASDFATSIALRVNERTAGGLVQFANGVAALRYEGTSSRGRMILARVDHPDCVVKVCLSRSVSTTDVRGLRKLLEVSGDEMALLCDSASVWGLGSVNEVGDIETEDLFEIQFVDHYAWELLHGSNPMLRVDYREPRLPRKRFDEDLLRDHAERLFKHADSDRLAEVVRAAVQQKHGTLIVITPCAEEEAARLGGQSTLVEPLTADALVIGHLSAVDGALLLTPQAQLHAFGVILDGMATRQGSPSRGARYNSAIRYVETQKANGTDVLTVIVSEDGYVNLYPELRPRIPRKHVDDLLRSLEEQAHTHQFDGDRSWAVLAKLDQLRFYLLPEDTKRANEAKALVVMRYEEEARKKALPGMGYILPPFSDFDSDPEMDRSYYTDWA